MSDLIKLSIIYQDDDLIVIDKPAGLVTTPAETISEMTVSDILQTDYGVKLERGGVVHRLDKDTSGILLAAKNQLSFDALQDQFRTRTIHKTYLALVHQFTPKQGRVEGNIGRNPQNREKFTVLDEGKEAVTDYQLLHHYTLNQAELDRLFPDFNSIQQRKLERLNYSHFSLLSVSPQTGRTHQIRVHLKHINFPIVGDDRYGGRKIVRLDHRWCIRQFLHAAKISLIHPRTKQSLQFESQLPTDLQSAIACLTQVG